MSVRRAPAVLLLLTCTACGIPAEDSPRALSQESEAGSSAAPTARPVPTGSQPVDVFLVRDQELVRVTRTTPPTPGPDLLLGAMLEGPTEAEELDGLRSVAPVEAATSASTPPTGVVTVTLPGLDPSLANGTIDEVLGYAQIVLTLDGSAEVSGVRFERDEQPVDVPRADGSLSNGLPVSATDYEELL